jgi:ADP-heptose:LPS heptosyltransferase
MVKARGGEVILATYGPLVELMKTVAGCDVVVSDNESLMFDIYCPLMELPRIFNTRLDTIPGQVPYLRADPAKAARGKARLNDNCFKVGIVWGASSLDKKATSRSCRLMDFIRLAGIPGVRLYGLQKGEPAGQMSEVPEGTGITNLGDDFEDFSDTAAAIENLDLVISVDTSVLHLAGAMGKPVWALTLFSPDWRWMSEGERCPWYPTMRLFRQQEAGCWEAVMERVVRELQRLVVARQMETSR